MRVGAYELLEPMADEGCGRLYRAQCVTDDRAGVAQGETVALAIFNRVREDTESCARFERRAGILLALSHPHIVRYLDAFKWAAGKKRRERHPCLVMELPQGESLARLFASKRRPASPAQQSRILRQTIEALCYAAEQQVLPRHVTPGDIILCASGDVQLLGFGTPRLRNESGATVAGGPEFFQYVAPDFIRAEQHGDETSCVFSAGVLFFQLLAGRLPFPALRDPCDRRACFSSYATAYRKRWRAAEPAGPVFPEEFFSARPVTRAFLEKCLAVEREARYPDFLSARQDLTAVCAELEPREETGTRRPAARRAEPARAAAPRRTFILLGAGLLAALLVAGGGILLSGRDEEPREVADAPASPSETTAPEAAEPPSLPQATLRDLALTEPVRVAAALPEPEQASGPAPAAAEPPPSAPPTEETAAPPVYTGKALVQVYVVKPEDGGPPVEVAYRRAGEGSWRAVREEVDLDPGNYSFRFARPDYHPVVKQLTVPPGVRGSFIASPGPKDWKPLPPLKKLLVMERARKKRDMPTLARMLAAPSPPAFAWAGHAERYRQLRQEWFQLLKRNTLAPKLGTIAFKVVTEPPPSGEPPVLTLYRRHGGKRWIRLTEQTLVQPGPYDLRFLRADYLPISKSVKIISGNASFEVMGPRLSDWQPGPQLEELLQLETALRDGDMDVLTARLAQPAPGRFKFKQHAQRLAQVRREWYRRLLGREQRPAREEPQR